MRHVRNRPITNSISISCRVSNNARIWRPRPFPSDLSLSPAVRNYGKKGQILSRLSYGDGARKEVEDSEKIKEDDLYATLEAHRLSNRAPKDPSPAYRDENTTTTLQSSTHPKPTPSIKDNGRTEDGRGPNEAMNTTCLSTLECSQEYEGKAQKLQREWAIDRKIPSSLRLPWLAYLRIPTRAPHERLSAEILAFEQYMQLSNREVQAEMRIIPRARAGLNRCFIVRKVGSRVKGFACPFSDYNFVIYPTDEEKSPVELNTESLGYLERLRMISEVKNTQVQQGPPQQSEFQKYSLHILEKALRIIEKQKSFDHIHISTGEAPTLRARHKKTNSLVEWRGPSVTSFDMQSETISAYTEEFKHLRPIYIALRCSLEMRSLTNIGDGGVGSYNLLIMIVTALKHAEHEISDQDVSHQLLHVLKFWAYSETTGWGYFVDPPERFQKGYPAQRWLPTNESLLEDKEALNHGLNSIRQPDPHRPYLLCLQDPAEYFNDLGKNIHAIKHVQATFAQLHEDLYYALHQCDTSGNANDLSKDSILAPLLEANYMQLEQHRGRLHQYGSQSEYNRKGRSYEQISLAYTTEQLLQIQRQRMLEYKATHSDDGNEHSKPRARREDLINKYQMPPGGNSRLKWAATNALA